MMKPKITKMGDPTRSRATQRDIIMFGGRERGVLKYPEATRATAERSQSGALQQIARGFNFRKYDASRLSHSQRTKAQNFKNSLVAYAEEYGTPKQASFFRKLSSAKIWWMASQGIIIAEEVFNYDDVLDELGLAKMGSPAQRTLQRYIDAYNQLVEASA